MTSRNVLAERDCELDKIDKELPLTSLNYTCSDSEDSVSLQDAADSTIIS